MNKFKVMLLIGVLATALISCDDDNGPNLPKGLTQADVDNTAKAAESLVLHIPFEDKATEVKGKRVAKVSDKVSYKKGFVGQAYQGAEGANIVYDLAKDDALNKLTSFTYSVWVKFPKTWEGGAGYIFQLADGVEFWGDLQLFNDTYKEQDTIIMKMNFKDNEASAWKEQWIAENGPFERPYAKDKWTRITTTYDEATSIARVYVNDQEIFADIRTEAEPVGADGKPIVVGEGEDYTKKKDATNKLGTLKFTTNKMFIVGHSHQKIAGKGDDWMKNFGGGIDELKIYSKALTPEQVVSTFKSELAAAN